MVSSIQANKYSFLNEANKNNSFSNVSVEKQQEVNTKKEDVKDESGVVKSVQGDMLTISETAKNRLEETKKEQQDEVAKANAEKNNGITKQKDANDAKALEFSGLSDELSEKLENDGTEELGGYTKYELKELLQDGTITQYQYAEELEDRNQEVAKKEGMLPYENFTILV